MRKQREGPLTTLPRRQNALQRAAFVLNAEDGVSWGRGQSTKSQKTSNNSQPFIFSEEIEKQGHFHVAAEGHTTRPGAACRGRCRGVALRD